MDTDSFMVYIKAKTFTQTLQRMLELDLKLQITTETDHYVKDKIKKVTGLMRYEWGRRTMKKFSALRSK